MNGEKGMLTEGGIREPWLAYWKGRIPAGQVYEHPVISWMSRPPPWRLPACRTIRCSME